MDQTQNQHENLPFLIDTLLCEEEQWEDCFNGEDEESSCIDNNFPQSCIQIIEQDMFWEDEELASLLSREKVNQIYHDELRSDPSLAEARREAVEWILKVNAFHSFAPLTAVLAVNYLDRFLCSFHFQREKPWTTQLVSIACISLAAKVEETQVPLLLDLQVEERRYFFEAKSIQMMEILVLSTLQWRMNPVTPIAFIDYILRRLSMNNTHLCFDILKKCELLVVSIVSDSRSLCHLPSVLASASLLHIMNSIDPSLAVEHQIAIMGLLRIDQSNLEECNKLIDSVGRQSNKRKFRWIPGSPTGVIDVSFSSADCSSDSWDVSGPASASVTSSPERESKKIRAKDCDQCCS